MADQDGEKGGKDLLVTMAGYTVAGESGINIKFSRAPPQAKVEAADEWCQF
jgi:hypothetical protein